MAGYWWREGNTSQRARLNHGATALGITPEQYSEHLQAGEAWCAYHKAWTPRALFYANARNKLTGVMSSCRDGHNAQARARQAAKKATVS